MARDGNGTYTKTFTAVQGTVISSSDFNTQIDDLATALTGSLAKNGETVPSTNLPMGNFKHTNVANAAATNQYAAAGQVQNGTLLWGGTAGGTSTAITISLAPAISAYAEGQRFSFIAASNSGGATTLAVNGLATKTVNNVGWLIGDIIEVIYSGTAFYRVNASWSGSVVMSFFQASAPIGWTQVTSQNDRVFRVVSGTGGGTGGAWAISGLSSESQAHTHAVSGTTGIPSANANMQGGSSPVGNSVHTHTFSAQTGGQDVTHFHSGDGSWRPAYIDVIIASGNLAR